MFHNVTDIGLLQLQVQGHDFVPRFGARSIFTWNANLKGVTIESALL
jgi:hypothetical protein